MSEFYQSLSHSKWDCKYHVVFCQGKVEMSPSQQNRNVPFSIASFPGHVKLMVPVREARSPVG
jgi:hypothetical protein